MPSQVGRHHGVYEASEGVEHLRDPAPGHRSGGLLTDGRLLVLYELQPEGGPLRSLSVEEPHGEVGEHPAVHDEVLAARSAVGEGHRLEEDGDTHAHSHRQGHVELVQVFDTERARVSGQDQEALLCQVRSDHLQLVTVERPRFGAPNEIAEGPYALASSSPLIHSSNASPSYTPLSLRMLTVFDKAGNRSSQALSSRLEKSNPPTSSRSSAAVYPAATRAATTAPAEAPAR